jgi:hypothetical protein
MKNITLKVYNDEYFDKWDRFVEDSRNGTIFHTRKFLSYHPKDRFKDLSLIFMQGGNIMSVIPACLQEKEGKSVLASHQGSTYGGFVIPFKLGLEKSFEMVDLLLEFSYKQGLNEIWMRYPEYIFEREPSHEIKFAIWKRGFRMDHIELSTCYDLDLYDADSPIIRQARKSYERDVSCKFDDDNFHEYYKILSENLMVKYKTTPTHTLEEILRLKDLLGDRCILVSAYYKDSLVGGLIVFITQSKTAHIFYSVVRKDLNKGIYVNDVVVDFAIRNLKKMGFKSLNYGISTRIVDEKINYELYRFKEKFKGFGIYRELWQWNT